MSTDRINRTGIFCVLFLVVLFGLMIARPMRHSAHAQTAANSCAAGQVVNSQLANTGQSCAIVASPLGTYVVAMGQNAALSSQTICDTSSTCPAGLYVLHVYIRPTSTGTLTSAMTPSITFTDDTGTAVTQSMGANISLVSTTPGSYEFNFYHAANTAVTVSTTFVTVTGTPVYNYRSRLVWLGS